jgi:hypothetical protein
MHKHTAWLPSYPAAAGLRTVQGALDNRADPPYLHMARRATVDLDQSDHSELAHLGGKPAATVRPLRHAGFCLTNVHIRHEVKKGQHVGSLTNSGVPRQGPNSVCCSLAAGRMPIRVTLCYNPDMAAIVGIHGIAQQFRGGYQLGTVWFDAIRDGLTVAGYQTMAEVLASSDLRVAYFGDLFRPQGGMAVQEPPFSAADVQAGPERDLLTKLYHAAVDQDPLLGLPAGSMGSGKAAVQVMVERLLRSETFAKVAQRAFIGNLKQVTSFLNDRSVKDLVLERVHQQVATTTEVVIGHSLGSVVAYEYLCLYRPPSVKLLVTLGSPLGIPTLVFDRLTPVPAHGCGAWPGTVAAWVNVADPNDIVALRKQLAGLFSRPSSGQLVDDRLVDNGDQPHAIDRYLNARQTGSALGDFLS